MSKISGRSSDQISVGGGAIGNTITRTCFAGYPLKTMKKSASYILAPVAIVLACWRVGTVNCAVPNRNEVLFGKNVNDKIYDRKWTANQSPLVHHTLSLQRSLQTKLHRDTSVLPTPALTQRGGSSAVGARTAPSAVLSPQQQQLIVRSVGVAIGCVMTTMLSATTPLNPLQAVCITSFVVAAVLRAPPAFAAAVFCGGTAGMSAHIPTDSEALRTAATTFWMSLMAALTGIAYYIFEQYKIGIGKGGRLGLMGWVGNVLYLVLGGPEKQKLLLSSVRHVFGKTHDDAAAVLVSTTAMYLARTLSTPIVHPNSVQLKGKPKSSILPAKTMRILYIIGKVGLFSALTIRLTTPGASIWTEDNLVMLGKWLKTSLTVGAGSAILKYSPTLVVPLAIVGLLGSALPHGNSKTIGLPLFLGALMGKTSIPNFTWIHFLQSSCMAATLMHLGIMDGFGGKLGLLAFASVIFGMPM